jgi:hypothetical protein
MTGEPHACQSPENRTDSRNDQRKSTGVIPADLSILSVGQTSSLPRHPIQRIAALNKQQVSSPAKSHFVVINAICAMR